MFHYLRLSRSNQRHFENQVCRLQAQLISYGQLADNGKFRNNFWPLEELQLRVRFVLNMIACEYPGVDLVANTECTKLTWCDRLEAVPSYAMSRLSTLFDRNHPYYPWPFDFTGWVLYRSRIAITIDRFLWTVAILIVVCTLLVWRDMS